jgi:Regulator of ribonuclease activity B
MSRSIDFYLYFPTNDTARGAGDELEKDGYSFVVRPAATGSNWLVLAKRESPISSSELDQAEEKLNQIACKWGGEYDGYERDV